MDTKVRGRFGVCVSAAAALLAGCGVLPFDSAQGRLAQDDTQPPIGARGAIPQASALAVHGDTSNYKVVYSFGAGSDDGGLPEATLIDVAGTLYGTTLKGGTNGEGTVFSITPGGGEKVLYSFGKSPDGNFPEAGLLDVGGTLYGTTSEGGSYDSCGSSYYVGCGTVFSVTTSGTEKVLHSFGGRSDGIYPFASLIELKGILYGTTVYGGPYNTCGYGSCGTVFSITAAGMEKVLYNFGKINDGAEPVASLIKVKDTLYGTTEHGGTNDKGTAFSITPSGTEKVLHSFGAGTDGVAPEASLIKMKGTFYGTTIVGPGKCNGTSICGTVFSITPSGTENVLHAFHGGSSDGAGPSAPLINVNGTLYGTTAYGGPHSCSGGSCGAVYSITPSGREKVLHYFGGGTDGVYPSAGLIDVNGTLYGTTLAGGRYGDGTVFALKVGSK